MNQSERKCRFIEMQRISLTILHQTFSDVFEFNLYCLILHTNAGNVSST